MNDVNMDRQAQPAKPQRTNINLPLAPGVREAIDELRKPDETRVGFIRFAIDRELRIRALNGRD